ncbi:MAG TPA: hypothetical protein VF834_23445 [Streptosporangiaceae bacterium]
MTIAIWILAVLLIAEFLMAPVNLWTGRTMPVFESFTGLPPRIATHVFAPVKLIGAILIAIGLVVPAAGIAGSVIIVAVCAVYLFRLAMPGRRSASGLAAFALFGSWAIALLVLLAVRGPS